MALRKQRDLMTAMTEMPEARRGDLTVRLAATPEEIDMAQALRYEVFYGELDAQADAAAAASRRDRDRFDAICDHLLVVRSGGQGDGHFPVAGGDLVGTYRLLRQEVAEAHGGFYTQSEFDIAPLVARHPDKRFLELGRSCVLKPFRTKPAVELLWQGIWDYVRRHRLDVMFGCASLEGADASQHRATLAFLAEHARPPAAWQVSALAGRRIAMAQEGGAPSDPKAALRALPPLVKGYLRLGCYIGDGAVADHQFNTTDVLIILPVSNINPRYFEHFGQPSE
jgi:putative hemolysin